MAEFTPQEFDALEDGLEMLGEDVDVATLDVPDTVRDRLADYQAILQLTRDALPVAEPSPSVLDAVLAEANAATAGAVAPTRPSLWQRWRKSLVPVLALAGTTAAVLWIVAPDAAREPDLPEMAAAERKHASIDDEPAMAPSEKATAAATSPIAEQSKREEAEEDAADPEPEPAQVAEEVPEMMPAMDAPANKAKKKGKMSPGKGGGGVPAAPPAEEPAVAPAPADKDSLWALVDSANTKRLAGTCGSAISLYRQVINGGQDDLARARAHAGIGLCLEYQGRDGEADTEFAKARAAAQGIDSWISGQRQRMPDKGTKKAKPNAKKAAKRKSQEAKQSDSL